MSTLREQPLNVVNEDAWRRAETAVVALVTVVIGMRLNLTHLISLGHVLSLILLPAWVSYLPRYRGARTVLVLGACAAVSGVVLTVLASDDHAIGYGTMLNNTALLVGLLLNVGFLLWARSHLSDQLLVVLFGLGVILGVSPADTLFASGAWKFGYATGVTLVVLGLAQWSRSRALELAVVAVLIGVSAVTDSRSALGILLLVAALLVWQLRPVPIRGRSALRGVLSLTVAAAAAYVVGQALIVAGYLGRETRARSLEQLNESGSLILGGRPEIAATAALWRDNPFGYGSGTHINHHDLVVAKTGMASLHYDPNNGYVEKYMFGTTYELHSFLGDLWSRFGLLGLALGVVMLVLITRRMGMIVTAGVTSAAWWYLATRSLWNLFFSPWYASIGLMTLTLALVLIERPPPP